MGRFEGSCCVGGGGDAAIEGGETMDEVGEIKMQLGVLFFYALASHR